MTPEETQRTYWRERAEWMATPDNMKVSIKYNGRMARTHGLLPKTYPNLGPTAAPDLLALTDDEHRQADLIYRMTERLATEFAVVTLERILDPSAEEFTQEQIEAFEQKMIERIRRHFGNKT